VSRTDFRLAEESEGRSVNSMIECSCDRIVGSRDELMEAIIRFFDSGTIKYVAWRTRDELDKS
jgi:hypothetical protein